MTHDFGLRGHAVGFVDDDDIPAAAGHRAEVHAPQQVPVEADGSAYFEAPVRNPIYFHAIDQHGTAVQSMRSETYVHHGEQLHVTNGSIKTGVHGGSRTTAGQFGPARPT